MALKTKKTLKKEKRNEEIKTLYGDLMSDPESMKFAIYERLAFKFKISTSSIGRIVGNVKAKGGK